AQVPRRPWCRERPPALQAPSAPPLDRSPSASKAMGDRERPLSRRAARVDLSHEGRGGQSASRFFTQRNTSGVIQPMFSMASVHWYDWAGLVGVVLTLLAYFL